MVEGNTHHFFCNYPDDTFEHQCEHEGDGPFSKPTTYLTNLIASCIFISDILFELSLTIVCGGEVGRTREIGVWFEELDGSEKEFGTLDTLDTEVSKFEGPGTIGCKGEGRRPSKLWRP